MKRLLVVLLLSVAASSAAQQDDRDTLAGYGKLVIIDHGGQAFSLYGHLLDISVARGARVSLGDAIGTAGFALLGVAGLYFELRIDGQPVDPLQWLRKR